LRNLGGESCFVFRKELPTARRINSKANPILGYGLGLILLVSLVFGLLLFSFLFINLFDGLVLISGLGYLPLLSVFFFILILSAFGAIYLLAGGIHKSFSRRPIYNFGILKRILTIIVNFIAIAGILVLVLICSVMLSLSAPDILEGLQTKCLIFKQISNQVRDSRRGPDKRYVIFADLEGKEIKIADVRQDYDNVKTGKQVCFDYYPRSNYYFNDRLV
jgi:hypothetical protein